MCNILRTASIEPFSLVSSVKGIGLLTLLACTLLASPARAEQLTVERALEIARQKNADIIAARQELEVARGHLVKARYLNPMNPEVSGEANHRQFGGGGGATDYGVALSQEVEVAGQRARRIAEAERNAERVEAAVRDRERLLDVEVKQAFFDGLATSQRLTLLRTVEDLNRRVRDASAARGRAGEAPPMEANLAEIRYGQSRKETIAAEATRTAALLELRRLLGLAPERAIEPSGDLRPPAPAVDLAAALDRALAQRPDLRAAVAEVQRAEAETALTRRLRIPNPTIEGFYHTDTNEGPSGADTIAGAGLRIPLPVFDRKQGELISLAQPDQILAVLDSLEMGEKKSVFLQARTNFEVARRTHQREGGLFREHVSSEKDYLQAKGELERSEAAYHAAREALRLLGLGDQEIDGTTWGGKGQRLSSFPLRAPFAGTVVGQHITVGELIAPTDPPYTIADLRTVWVLVDIYEKDLARVGHGAAAEVAVEAYAGEIFAGTVTYLSHIVDPTTRTAEARVEVDNRDGRLRPGMFATATIHIPASGGEAMLAAPRAAIQQVHGQSVAFVEERPGAYVMRALTLGREVGPYVEVRSGLTPGERVVTDGAFFLKSILLKEEIGGEED